MPRSCPAKAWLDEKNGIDAQPDQENMGYTVLDEDYTVLFVGDPCISIFIDIKLISKSQLSFDKDI